ncbi:hypothetical protein CBOM_08148 [Ceraceosorus bombacis]|uniref:Uncharacterized protein n=1 Tax=Ceraceosorus bombacis TaxID=401625 RepID=A0A0P1B9H3_9BASI|nr:hypothetical protein CBOM_08148 [Ceraceosorus bombacis]
MDARGPGIHDARHECVECLKDLRIVLLIACVEDIAVSLDESQLRPTEQEISTGSFKAYKYLCKEALLVSTLNGRWGLYTPEDLAPAPNRVGWDVELNEGRQRKGEDLAERLRASTAYRLSSNA